MSIKKWLTLIEVLLAIVLFGSGIVVILSIIIQNISLSTKIRNKTIATMLAKESIEMFFNYKDSNIDRWEFRNKLPWWTITFNQPYSISFSPLWMDIDQTATSWLFLQTWNSNWLIFPYYTHKWWMQTNFYRSCIFVPISVSPQETLPSDMWAKITCRVIVPKSNWLGISVDVSLSSALWQNRE